MTIEWIGAVTIAMGMAILHLGFRLGMLALTVSSLLGAAAAIQLPSLGGASIPPAYVLLPFLAISVARSGQLRATMPMTVAFPGPGFWLITLVIYGALSAFFLPRIFSGLTYVYSFVRTESEFAVQVLPLSPAASNITQPLYLGADLLCFTIVAAWGAVHGSRSVVYAILIAAIVNLVFVGLDIATYVTDTRELMSIIRNANYSMLDDSELGGIKRIVGSYPEAATYASVAIGFFAFFFRQWLAGINWRLNGAIALMLLLTLLAGTSTTGYVSLLIYSVLMFLSCITRIMVGRANSQQTLYVFALPIAVLLIAIGAMLLPALFQGVENIFDEAIFNKLESESGVERTQWNEQAIRSFLDTMGMGAGLGSVRASSLPVALLANVGVIGALLFGALLVSVARAIPSSNRSSSDEEVGRSGAVAALALVIPATVGAGSIDLGLYFSIFAGLAASSRIASVRRLRCPLLPRLAPGAALTRFR
jgi:O-Antigen ligase